LLTAGLSCVGIAYAQPWAKPADVSPFDIAGLKSKLMVTSLTRNQQARHNEFVQRFRTDLMTQERAQRADFARVANRDQAGHTVLPAECRHLQRGAVTAKGSDLAVYGASETLPQPIEVVACPALTRTAQVGAVVRRHVANYSLS
jgi:hypothetical protein